ncbi:MAG TPA: nuclear transport factor 2 family protein [Burkholderiales bacterium]|nr:nuclear transport factor 2 family protein [Burkholderiales bacterium]
MSQPIETVNRLTDALNRGDLEAAAALYEPNAVLVVQPGELARGSHELRTALGRFIALRPTLRAQAQHVVEADAIAMYIGRWTLQGTDPAGQPVSMGGESSDILRRQPDGRWLIAVDNPWGGRILG